MKSVFRFWLIVFILLGSSAPTVSAGAVSNYSRSSLPQDTHIPSSGTFNQQSSIYLPLTFSNYKSPCLDIPQQVLSLFDSSLVAYYPLWETGGNSVVDLGPANLSGVYAGNPSLNKVSALCGNAPAFDGLDDVANVFSPGLASAFNGDEGTAIIQLKVEPEQWTDGKTAYYLALRADKYNNLVLFKSAPNQLEFAYTAGGTRLSVTFNDIATSNWVTYAVTWSKSRGEYLGYLAGESVDLPRRGLGSWSGELTSAEIAGYWESSSNYARGSISSVVLLDREATADEIRQYSAIFGATQVLSVLGDSISRVNMTSPWSLQAVFEYQGGNQVTLKSHAQSGHTIMDNMDDQVIAAAADDADIIIIALGTVDNNNGNMAALQAEVEENIAELKLSNPRARLFYLNVLPIWTDKSGSDEVDKSNIRTAIAAACASQGITCWDTYTIPWINPSDTSDGVHPNAAGHAKIANQVLLRLQSSLNDVLPNSP